MTLPYTGGEPGLLVISYHISNENARNSPPRLTYRAYYGVTGWPIWIRDGLIVWSLAPLNLPRFSPDEIAQIAAKQFGP